MIHCATLLGNEASTSLCAKLQRWHACHRQTTLPRLPPRCRPACGSSHAAAAAPAVCLCRTPPARRGTRRRGRRLRGPAPASWWVQRRRASRRAPRTGTAPANGGRNVAENWGRRSACGCGGRCGACAGWNRDTAAHDSDHLRRRYGGAAVRVAQIGVATPVVLCGLKTQLGMSWLQQACSGRLDADERITIFPPGSNAPLYKSGLFQRYSH